MQLNTALQITVYSVRFLTQNFQCGN